MSFKQPNSRIRTRQDIAWGLEDARDFEALLRDAFPQIRFLRWDYKLKWRELWRWRPVILEMSDYRDIRKDGLWQPPCEMRDPGDEPLLYRDSLTYPWESHFLCWVEPDGWKPEWWCLKPGRDYELINMPRCRFEFRRSGIHWQTKDGSRPEDNAWVNGHEFWRPPDRAAEHEIHYMNKGTLHAWWADGDKQAESFARKVFRLANKLMSNEFRVVDRETLMPESSKPAYLGDRWAGHHAMKWAAERRHNYIFGFLKPPDYDFGPDEPDD